MNDELLDPPEQMDEVDAMNMLDFYMMKLKFEEARRGLV